MNDKLRLLYPEIKEFVMTRHNISRVLLQRQFRLSYADATRIMALLEFDKVVGPQQELRPRKVNKKTTKGG